MQKTLFNELPKEDQPAAITHLLDLKLETRRKNNINKKIEKIKKLKEKFEQLRSRVEELKDIYEQQIGPIENELIENKEAFIEKLLRRYKEKGFTQWQTEMISTIIFNEIMEIENHGDTSERVDQIKEELKDLMEDKMSDADKSMMREMAKEFMKFSGMDVDEDFDIFNESQFEEARQRSNEYHEKEEHEQEEQQKRDKVLKTDKDFQKLYKNLVKKVHPDLVIDPKEKEKRELLMKELSHAWEERDYYNLLMLKSQIEPGDDAIDLGKEQTKMLVKQLNEEINTWESKHYSLKHMDSNTSFYFENFYDLHQSTSMKKFEEYKKEILRQTEVAANHLEQIKTKKATKEFLKATRETHLEEEDDHFDFF